MDNAWVRVLGVATGAMVATAAIAACTSASSVTDLRPDGPPMIAQVRLFEAVAAGEPPGVRTVFAFGTHPLASADDAHPVTTAAASRNRLRIVVDELLVGDGLEEIACRSPVDDDAFARVPAGVTPDDVVRCTAAQDALASRCPGSNPRSLCICQLDGGCPGEGPGTPRGASVGVLDRDQDGAADVTRLIDGAVAIRCGAIDVPIDLDASFWTPSGNQQLAAQGGFDALGPAVVAVPRGALPTGLACGVTFSPGVVDRDGHRVCAPPDGDVERGCTPGDTSAIGFAVEPLGFRLEAAVADPGQSRTMPIKLKANAPLDAASLAGITVDEAGASYAAFTATLSMPDEVTIAWTAVGGLAAATRYTITVPTGVTDLYHQAAGQALAVAFTTGAN